MVRSVTSATLARRLAGEAARAPGAVAVAVGAPDAPGGVAPRRTRRPGRVPARGAERGEDRDECCDLLRGGVGVDDPQERGVRVGRRLGRHSGMLPCFLGGSVSRLERSTAIWAVGHATLMSAPRCWEPIPS